MNNPATRYILIDFENTPVKSLALLKDKDFHIKVFLGPNNKAIPTDLAIALQTMREHGDYIVLDVPGKNALDFYITYYLGVLSTTIPTGVFYIISKDKGFDSLIKHLNGRNIHCGRFASIEQIPGVRTAPPAKKKESAKPVAAAKPVAPAKPVVPKPAALKPVAPAKPSALEKVLETVVADLINLKTAKPRTKQRLINAIRNFCGKDCPQATIDQLYEALVKRGHIKVEGVKVVYNLPREVA